MKIRYFADTDTALIEFSNESIVETKEISENLYIDLDGKGNLVSMTIEHAKEKANISEVSYLQMNKMSSKEILEKAMALKPDERFMIVEGLLKSLDEPDRKIDEIWAEEAEKRLKAYRDGRLEGIPMEE